MINVTPIDDIMPHTNDSTCHCQPLVEVCDGELIIIHSSFDGREALEEVNDILNGS